MNLPPIDPSAAASGALAVTNAGFPLDSAQIMLSAERLSEQVEKFGGDWEQSGAMRLLRFETATYIDLHDGNGVLIASQRVAGRNTTIANLPDAKLAVAA